jgi:DNA/RNA-binding domain of Phe-tRNA-synthetase-like protein
MLTVEPHPLLEVAAFTTEFPRPLEAIATPAAIRAFGGLDARAPFATNDAVKKAVRDLLRQSGYKPTGRGKPASEYLLGVAAEGPLPEINVAVDACNVVSLHSGLPISVIDLDRAREPLSIRVALDGESYVFNATGQTIDLAGLLCLCDADGPCANAVKDAQRTKTGGATRRTLSIVWGTVTMNGRARDTARWYRELLAGSATTSDADVRLA